MMDQALYAQMALATRQTEQNTICKAFEDNYASVIGYLISLGWTYQVLSDGTEPRQLVVELLGQQLLLTVSREGEVAYNGVVLTSNSLLNLLHSRGTDWKKWHSKRWSRRLMLAGSLLVAVWLWYMWAPYAI